MAVDEVQRAGAKQLQATVRKVGSWVEPLGRAGHVAKGVLYVLIGMLAAQVACGTRPLADIRKAIAHSVRPGSWRSAS